jgi:Xaa-Pro dipeptidase
MKSRIERLFTNIGRYEDETPDVVVIANATEPMLDMTFFYVTGLRVGRFEGSFAVLRPDGSLDVITSLLEAESASKGDFPLHVFKSADELKQHLTGLLKGSRKIGINGSELTYKSYTFIKEQADAEAQLLDMSKAVTRTRMKKDEEEIATMKKACHIASEVAGEMKSFIEEGMAEYVVSAELTYLMQKRGAAGPAFESIVAFGKNSAEPHYSAGNALLKKGDFALLDFGALYKLYRSDITRTYFCGEPSAEQRRMYEVVREAQQRALDTIIPGEKASVPHEVAAEYIDSTEYKGLFTHGLGHGLGLATHDGGGLNPRAEDIALEEGMVFTVEPGVYKPGFGGVRIEDDIVVRNEGPELLTTASREISVL